MAILRTFVLVYEDKVISPNLVTVREYGKWFEQTYPETISHMHLYLNSKKANGYIVSEWHPGTRLGSFFDSQPFHKPEFKSWYIPSTGKTIDQLVAHNLVELKDCSTYNKRNMLRVYTVQQIETYIQSAVDSSFRIGNDILNPQQIVLSKSDMDKLIKPVMSTQKKLF